MTAVRLLPRLSSLAAMDCIRELDSLPDPHAAPPPDYVQRGFERAGYAATGGTRDDEYARELALALRRLATEHGLGTKAGQAGSQSEFDAAAARFLATCEGLQSGEAMRDDVWTFMATVLLPDVVAWRFPKRAMNRYLGGVRNAFQRLWVRGTCLDRGDGHADRWGLISALTEDAFVQVFERASIPASPGLARAVAEEWSAVASREGRAVMQAVARSAIKLIRIRNEIIDLSSLEPAALEVEVGASFQQALSARKKIAAGV